MKESTGLLVDMEPNSNLEIIPSCESNLPLKVDLCCLKDIT